MALARSLFRLAQVGEAIPEELYEAAAAVLVQVYGHGQARTDPPDRASDAGPKDQP